MPPPTNNAAQKRASKDQVLKLVGDALKKAGAQGLAVADLNPLLHRQYGHGITTLGFKTWHAFLAAHPDRFVCDPRGKAAKVRLKPA